MTRRSRAHLIHLQNLKILIFGVQVKCAKDLWYTIFFQNCWPCMRGIAKVSFPISVKYVKCVESPPKKKGGKKFWDTGNTVKIWWWECTTVTKFEQWFVFFVVLKDKHKELMEVFGYTNGTWWIHSYQEEGCTKVHNAPHYSQPYNSMLFDNIQQVCNLLEEDCRTMITQLCFHLQDAACT